MMGGGVETVVEVLGAREGSGGGEGTHSANARGTAVVASGNCRIWSVVMFCVGWEKNKRETRTRRVKNHYPNRSTVVGTSRTIPTAISCETWWTSGVGCLATIGGGVVRAVEVLGVREGSGGGGGRIRRM